MTEERLEPRDQIFEDGDLVYNALSAVLIENRFMRPICRFFGLEMARYRLNTGYAGVNLYTMSMMRVSAIETPNPAPNTVAGVWKPGLN
jgi:hypothetical protein